jgi:cytochrome c oxidase cbb3-type subunit III
MMAAYPLLKQSLGKISVMRHGKFRVAIGVLAAAAWLACAQEPPAPPASPSLHTENEPVNAAAIAGSKQDPQAVARGRAAFKTYCAGCHGAAANGGPGAPDLVRSLVVLDDEKGILIAPVIREGRPDRGMPKLNLTEAQISDLVAWLHARTYAAGHRGTYVFGNVITGDAKKGQAYFNSAGGCNACHSPTGDLAGIGSKHEALALQSLWLHPGGRKGAGSRAAKPTVTVTLPSGKSISGTLDRADDFTVSLRDADGRFHSFARDGQTPEVVIHDPLSAHSQLLHKYTDADIHNVTAYLVSLK